MRAHFTTLLVVVGMFVVGCGGASSSASTMPGVTGQRLDVAYSDLASAGVAKDDVEIVGGGTFGVIDESNWQVCEQRPAPGAAISSVRLVVDRTCPDAVAAGNGTSDEAAAADSSGSDFGDSTGGDTFTMPEVVGMVLQDAQDLLQSKGSYLMDQVDATGMGRFQVLDSNWIVCVQQPKPGAKVSAETTVTLSAVKLDESCP